MNSIKEGDILICTMVPPFRSHLKLGSKYSSRGTTFNQGYGSEVSILNEDGYIFDAQIIYLSSISEVRSMKINDLLDGC